MIFIILSDIHLIGPCSCDIYLFIWYPFIFTCFYDIFLLIRYPYNCYLFLWYLSDALLFIFFRPPPPLHLLKNREVNVQDYPFCASSVSCWQCLMMCGSTTLNIICLDSSQVRHVSTVFIVRWHLIMLEQSGMP